ncbi:MAG: plasmid pRiA4b ORF-3 family protein [Sphaerochaeta sp.]|nr:plasmid pRiA4b ORF-3 family protein [Sphaerochaeta sp.]
MYIQCTKKLFEHLDPLCLKLSTPYESTYCWHANCFELHGLQYVMFLNDTGDEDLLIKVESFQDFGKQVELALHFDMEKNGLTAVEIAKYMEDTGPIAFALTQDQVLIARLNNRIKRLKESRSSRLLFPGVFPDTGNDATFENSLDAVIERVIDKILGDLAYPMSRNTAKTKSKAPKKIVPTSALSLDKTPMIAIDAELMLYREEKVTRSFLVPLEMDFGTLGTILQMGFGWSEGSGHEFHLKRDTIRIGADSSDMYMRLMFEGKHTQVLSEGETVLSDFIPGVRKIQYHFGFDRGWLLDISVKKAPDADGGPYVTCTGGQGTTPPEDCGGPPGYDELCEILGDPTHVEYAETVEWIHDNRNAKFDLKRINTALKRLKFVDTTR